MGTWDGIEWTAPWGAKARQVFPNLGRCRLVEWMSTRAYKPGPGKEFRCPFRPGNVQ